jgi:hypothetical protein
VRPPVTDLCRCPESDPVAARSAAHERRITRCGSDKLGVLGVAGSWSPAVYNARKVPRARGRIVAAQFTDDQIDAAIAYVIGHDAGSRASLVHYTLVFSGAGMPAPQ